MIHRWHVRGTLPHLLHEQSVVAKWRVLECVGLGAYGEIYSAQHCETGMKVALKVESILSTKKSLLAEVAAMRKLQDIPFLCQYYTCGRIEHMNYAVIQLLGVTLSAIKKKQPKNRFTPIQCARLISQALECCNGMHQKEMIHRDIKPENFCMGPNKRFRVIRKNGSKNSLTSSMNNRMTAPISKISPLSDDSLVTSIVDSKISCHSNLSTHHYSLDIREQKLELTQKELLIDSDPLNEQKPTEPSLAISQSASLDERAFHEAIESPINKIKKQSTLRVSAPTTFNATKLTPHLYLIDFGLARKKSIQESLKIPGFRGTRRYASVNAHQGKELSYRDDLWSLFFLGIELYRGSLPWDHLCTRNNPHSPLDGDDTISKMKKELIQSGHLMNDLPEAYHVFLSHLQTLSFGSFPDYDLLLSTFNKWENELIDIENEPKTREWQWNFYGFTDDSLLIPTRCDHERPEIEDPKNEPSACIVV